jgi:hypothetical protein
MTRVARGAYWLTPMLFCVALYWLGLRSWFWEDDFPWLNLRNHVIDFHTFLWAMFTPLAQGTIRPLSERAFFMAFSYFFGLHARAYHEFVFLNQLVDIALLMVVTRKLTKSNLAGFLAPVLWLCNVAMVTPLGWTSAYNEVQCAMFLLLSFYLFLRYTETGRRGFYWAQWATFLLGFGANEINVVFPAIAALYAILFARRYWRSTLPMFAVSAAYTVVHQLVRGGTSDFYYDMDFHIPSLAKTLWQYWRILLAFRDFVAARDWRPWLATVALLALTVTLIGFITWQARQRRFLPLFMLGWFLITLAPLLPLHNHVTDYYLFIPTVGVAMLAAYGIALAWKQPATRVLAAALALLYATPSAMLVHRNTGILFNRGERSRTLIQSVAYAKHIHPGKTILLENVDDELFWSAVYGSPFRIFGWSDVFMTPDCIPLIRPDPHFGSIDPYILPASAVAHALRDGSAVVYAVEDRRLRNITRTYTAVIRSQPEPPLASYIDVGASYFQSQLGEGWYGIEGGFRWSQKRAVVYLAGPSTSGRKLVVHGYASEAQTKAGPLRFALDIQGRQQPVKVIDRENPDVRFEYDLPADLIGRPRIEIGFTLDRTVQVPGDERDLGLPFGEFGIQ